MRSIQTLLILTFSILLSTQTHAGGRFTIEDAWIPEAPPVSKVHAAYMKFINDTAMDIEITGVTSDSYGRIEMHRSVENDGVASMVHRRSLIVPAYGSLILEPGSYHLMLFTPVSRKVAGDKVVLELQTFDGRKERVIAEVRRAGHAMTDHSHHQH